MPETAVSINSLNQIPEPTTDAAMLVVQLLESISDGVRNFRENRKFLEGLEEKTERLKKSIKQETEDKKFLEAEADGMEKELEKLQEQVEKLERKIHYFPDDLADVIQEMLDFTPPDLVPARMKALCEGLRDQTRKPMGCAELDYRLLVQRAIQWAPPLKVA